MRWRCDDNFLDNLDRLTLGLAKGSSLALITYLVIKMIAIAHDNEWGYLLTGWGHWFMLEIFLGVLLPLGLFAYAIRHNRPGLVRFTAFLTIFGVALNRINTALIAFNWNLYQEIPGWREVVICLTLFSVYAGHLPLHPVPAADRLFLEGRAGAGQRACRGEGQLRAAGNRCRWNCCGSATIDCMKYGGLKSADINPPALSFSERAVSCRQVFSGRGALCSKISVQGP